MAKWISQSGFFLIFCAGIIARPAAAITTLKQVTLGDSGSVDLVFDSSVSDRQISTEFLRDIVQIVISDTSIYPAKSLSGSTGPVKKIFAYQYTPKVVRVRLTVDSDAKDYENGFQIVTKGKLVTLKLKQKINKDQIAVTAAQSVRVLPEDVAQKQKTPLPIQERATIEQSVKKNSDKAVASTSPLKSFAWLFLSAFVLGITVLFYKVVIKKVNVAERFRKILPGSLRKAIQAKFGAPGRLIEVLSNHHLGPKKSISVVKIKGRTLVLGVTDDSINLISDLTGFEDKVSLVNGEGAWAAGPVEFGALLSRENQEMSEPSAPVRNAAASSVRQRIRLKTEGLKSL